MNVDDISKGAKMIEDGLQLLSAGPFSYTLENLIAARTLLFTRYAPFKIGERVVLKVTPTISKQSGWNHCRHFLKSGALGTVDEIDLYKDGLFRFHVIFDEETWIDREGNKQPVDNKHTFCFLESALALAER